MQETVKIDGGLVAAKASRRRWLMILCAVLVIALGGGAAWCISSGVFRTKNVAFKDTVAVTRGSVDLKINATGTIKPINEVKISPKVTGLLKRLYVVQGQALKKGQAIALMDDSNLLGQIEALESALRLAQANYDKTVNGNRPQEIANSEQQVVKNQHIVRSSEQAVNRAEFQVKSFESQLTRDSTNARRLAQLASEGAVSDQDRLNASTQSDIMQAQLRQAKQELKQSQQALAQSKADLEAVKQQFSLMKAGYREEDQRAAKFARDQAAGNLHFLQSQLNDTRIRAPFDGVVSQKYADEGAIVTPTTSAATTSATSSSIVSLAGRLEMVAEVAETDMDHIAMGQKVEITANAYPEQVFHGHVNLIAPEAVVTANVTTFEVHVGIDDDPKNKLMAGMNVNAEFLAGRQDDVLIVPTVCISSQMGRSGVLVPDKDGNPSFKPVRTGPTSGTTTVIVSGLHEGDHVFLGLSKSQLEQQGYGDKEQSSRGGGFGGGRKSPQMPRSMMNNK